MKRYLSFFLFFLAFTFSLIAAELSDSDSALIYKTLDARLKTRLFETPDEAISFLNNFKSEILNDKDYNSAGKEAKIIFENMIALERYNYMYAKDINSKELKPYIIEQYKKIEAFQKANENQEFSPWFVLSSGDVINSSMQFIPQGTAIKLGLKEKDDYDKVVKKYPSLAFGRINRALWYYFAPAIGGGSKNVAKEDFENAVKNASCNYEKFYSRIYLSQVYFDEGKKEVCKKLLSECDEILPGNFYTPFIKILNDSNYSLLYYVINREKVDKKLGL